MAYGNFPQRGGGGGQRAPYVHKPNKGSALRNKFMNSPGTPGWKGDFAIDAEVLDYVMSQAQNGRRVVLGFSAWDENTQAGEPKLRFEIELPRDEKKRLGLIPDNNSGGYPRQQQHVPDPRQGGQQYRQPPQQPTQGYQQGYVERGPGTGQPPRNGGYEVQQDGAYGQPQQQPQQRPQSQPPQQQPGGYAQQSGGGYRQQPPSQNGPADDGGIPPWDRG